MKALLKNNVLAKAASRWSVMGLVSTVCAALCLPLTSIAQSNQRQLLRGHVPAVTARLQPVSSLPGLQRLDLSIGLPLRNKEALANLLEQLYNPASTNYHQYLTPEQFAERFGPTEQDYQAVAAFARANGFTVTGTHPNRMLLDVNGGVSDIEKAFQVGMRLYHHPTENRNFFAPNAEPSVPSGLPILDISGLNNYGRPHSNLKATPLSQVTVPHPNAGSGLLGTYLGGDFRAAYAPGVTLNGSGQTVALVQFDGFDSNDITAYETNAGLPRVPLETVLLDNFNGQPTGDGGEVEVSLDIDMAVSMAPGLSKVILYEGNPFNFFPNHVLNRIATDNTAHQISCSWGWIGGPTLATDQIFQQMMAQGQSFFVASGDDDAYLPGAVDDPLNFGTPADSAYVTSVGGTTLTTGPNGAYVSETVWNWGGGTGSSGGTSSYYPLPVWQQGISMAANQGSTTFRNIPDVALTADNVYVIADSGIAYDVGGTSCASPLWAGFTALINQKAASTGRPVAGFINPAIYAIALAGSYAANFHDTRTGDNTSPTSPFKYFATSGYDLCTGLGTPAGLSLIDALAGNAPRSGILQLSVNPPSGSALIASTNQLIFVTVSDVYPVTNATVVASVAGVPNIIFLDNGVSPDQTKNDGIYSASFLVPAALGPLTLTVMATNVPGEVGATNTVQYNVIPLPPNDDFVNAIKVPAGGAAYQANNRFASLELGEPKHDGMPDSSASLWWSWTPLVNTNVLIDTTGSAIHTAVAVYTGTAVNALTPVAATNDNTSTRQVFVGFNAVGGTTYHIAVAATSATSLGSVNLLVAPGGLPDTDPPTVFVTSPLSGVWVNTPSITVSGTADDPQPNASGLSHVLISVNGQWRFTAQGTTNWTSLIGLAPGLNSVLVTASDVAGNSSATVPLQITYFIQSPANDLFAQAIPLTLTNNSGVVIASTTNATVEFGEPDITGNPGGQSVWWSFQAPADGVLTLNTTNSTFDTLLGLYTGTSVADLATIAENDDAYPGAKNGFSFLDQAVRSNQVYHIAVDGFAGASGTAVLAYSFAPTNVYRLSVGSGAGGTVHVTSTNTLGGIAALRGSTGDFATNADTVLTAVPNPYYTFNAWSGSVASVTNPLSVLISSNLNITGSFGAMPFTDGFEGGTLQHLPWVTRGDAPWFVQTAVVGAGQYAARSGVIGNGQSSSLILTMTNLLAGTGSFDYRVSSETNFDTLSFSINGIVMHRWSGEAGWANFVFPLPAGTNTLQWTYSKDATLSAGMDAAFLDDLNLPLAPVLGPFVRAALQLLRQSDGSFEVSLIGQTNQQYIIQASTNLVNWQNISTNTAVGGVILLPDPTSVTNPIRFYRSVNP